MFGRVGNLIRGVGTPKRKRDKKQDSESPKDAGKIGLGFEVMEGAMQKKLQKGVKYNMKVLIRGERRSGKSSLLRRLQGKYHDEGYNQTPQLNAATVHWCSEFTQDPVKVEVWDVVDSGFITQELEDHHNSLNAPPGIEVQVSDASNVNVYRDAHCVIFMIDATKKDALTYLATQLPKVPQNVVILVLRNKCDLVDDIVISEKDISKILQQHQRTTTQFLSEICGSGKIPDKYSIAPHCINSSMVNCYGIKNLYSYLNIPFQKLRCEIFEETFRQLWSSSQNHISDVKEMERPYPEYEAWLIEQSQKNQQESKKSPVEDEVKPPLAPKSEGLLVENTTESPQPEYNGKKNNLSFKHQGSFNLNAIDEGFFDDVSDDEENEQQNRPRSSADSEDLIAAVAIQRGSRRDAQDDDCSRSSSDNHGVQPASDSESESVEEIKINFGPVIKKESKTRSKIEDDEGEKRIRIANAKTQSATELWNDAIKKDKKAEAEKEEEFARQIDIGGIDESFFDEDEDDDDNDDDNDKEDNTNDDIEIVSHPKDACDKSESPEHTSSEVPQSEQQQQQQQQQQQPPPPPPQEVEKEKEEEEEELPIGMEPDQSQDAFDFKPKPEPTPRETSVSAEALHAVQQLMQNMQTQQEPELAEDTTHSRRRRKEAKESTDDKKEKRRRRRKDGDEVDAPPKEKKEKKEKKDKRRRRREEPDVKEEEEEPVTHEERSQ